MQMKDFSTFWIREEGLEDFFELPEVLEAPKGSAPSERNQYYYSLYRSLKKGLGWRTV